jgi:mRNA-degrading endonuclease toxin of MazEF toxin-antitoxin module
MAFPEPRPGLVISYAYLWHHEHRAGREEGVKDRPCVIILAAKITADGTTMVRVVPVTHRPPDDPATAVELPQAVKRHLDLDSDRSWVVLDEVNEFTWPGFDLRPISRMRDSVAYGFLPPRLFNVLTARLAEVWAAGQGNATPRD